MAAFWLAFGERVALQYLQKRPALAAQRGQLLTTSAAFLNSNSIVNATARDITGFRIHQRDPLERM